MVSMLPKFHNNTPTKSKMNVPAEFICPITKEVMVHPLMNRTGRSYERAAIIDWITNKHGPSCPVTKEPLYVKDLLPNTRLRNEIIAWYESQGDDTSSYHVDDETVREVEVMRALNVALSPQKKPKKNVLGVFTASTTSPRKTNGVKV